MKGQGRHVPQMFSRTDNSHNNIQFETYRDPLTGQVSGVRISACRACSKYPSLVHSISGVCGRQSCYKRRTRKFLDRVKAKRAEAARAGAARTN